MGYFFSFYTNSKVSCNNLKKFTFHLMKTPSYLSGYMQAFCLVSYAPWYRDSASLLFCFAQDIEHHITSLWKLGYFSFFLTACFTLSNHWHPILASSVRPSLNKTFLRILPKTHTPSCMMFLLCSLLNKIKK